VDFILPGSVTANALAPPPQGVPEPATALLIVPVLAGWMAFRRKSQRVVDGPTRD
jgi:hypothetical protein